MMENIQCPKVIAEAINKVQSEIKRIEFDAENGFAGYKYLSIDGYYEAIRPLIVKHGINIIGTEEESALSPDGKTMKCRIAFYVTHMSGEVWNLPMKHTIYIPFTGGQTAGAALSYADKCVMRTLFKISTGDEEQVMASEPVVKADMPDADPVNPEEVDAQPQSRKGGQDAEIDYDYNGAPYRMFESDMRMSQTFSDVRGWGKALKLKLNKKPHVPGLYEANVKEIERIKTETADIQDITPKAREALDKLFEDLEAANPEKSDD